MRPIPAGILRYHHALANLGCPQFHEAAAKADVAGKITKAIDRRRLSEGTAPRTRT